MAEQMNPTISIALDMKKHRIRIHKPTIHLLGNPVLIQLLFNPVDMVVAIICPDCEVPGGQEIRLNPKNLRADNCVDIHSKMFLRKLRTLKPEIEPNHVYRLTGSIIPSMRAARFPLSTLQRVECDEVTP